MINLKNESVCTKHLYEDGALMHFYALLKQGKMFSSGINLRVA